MFSCVFTRLWPLPLARHRKPAVIDILLSRCYMSQPGGRGGAASCVVKRNPLRLTVYYLVKSNWLTSVFALSPMVVKKGETSVSRELDLALLTAKVALFPK